MSYIPSIPGSCSSHDDYGYSLMAIYVRRNGVSFYGLAFSHPESNIPGSVDILVTHEPPLAILHGIEGTNWGNLPLLKRIYDIKPKFHLFGHTLNLEQEPIIKNI